MSHPNLADDQHGRLYARLASRNQQHVLRWWPDLTQPQRQQLCRQVQQLDLELLDRLHGQADSGEVSELPPAEAIRPAEAVSPADSPQATELGRQALAAGQVAVVLVAGGQGTRLGHNGPKGTFPIGPVSKRSLFQIHAEKVLAISRRYSAPLPLYVMTSPDNDRETRQFFAGHEFFGLDRGQVVFFQQGTMPALDRQTGRLLMAEKHRIATSPNGHGGVLGALADGGHLADMRRRGIRYLFYYQVDNPMVKVADPGYLGHHIRAGAEISVKVVRKAHPQEKLGVVVEVDRVEVDSVEVGGRLQLIEYSDLPAEAAQRRLPDGGLEIWAGNIAVHVFNLSFLRRLTTGGVKLPYHRAIKKVPCLDDDGRTGRPAEPNAVKFETFVFDTLPLARRALVVETDRREEFEPLKNARGDSSPASLRQAMSNLYAGWLDRLDIQVRRRPDGSAAVPVEISPLLAIDAEELSGRLPWRGPVNEPLLLDEQTELVRHRPNALRWHTHPPSGDGHRRPGRKPVAAVAAEHVKTQAEPTGVQQ